MTAGSQTAAPTLADRAGVYQSLWDRVEIVPDRVKVLDRSINKIIKGKSLYTQISKQIGIPLHVVGILHLLEGNCDMGCQACAKKTVGALDKLSQWDDWTIAGTLYALEDYSGWKYFEMPIYTPYLWNFTNFYQWGKFGIDGSFQPTAIADAPGAVAIIKRMLDQEILRTAPLWV